MKKCMCMFFMLILFASNTEAQKQFFSVFNGYDVSIKYKTILKEKKVMIELASSDTGVVYQLWVYKKRKFVPIGIKEYGTGEKLLFMSEESGIYAIDSKISFGAITLPHGLAKVTLLEQLYRIMTIEQGKNYHY